MVSPGTFLFEASKEEGRATGAAVFTEVPRERTPGYRRVNVSFRTTADAAGPAGEIATVSLIFRPAGSSGAEPAEVYVSQGRSSSEGDVRMFVRRDEPGRIEAVFAAVLRGEGGAFLPVPGGRQRVEGGFSALLAPDAVAVETGAER